MRIVGELGEKVFGGRVRQGNQVYAPNGISPTLLAGSIGNVSGNNTLILVDKKDK